MCWLVHHLYVMVSEGTIHQSLCLCPLSPTIFSFPMLPHNRKDMSLFLILQPLNYSVGKLKSPISKTVSSGF